MGARNQLAGSEEKTGAEPEWRRELLEKPSEPTRG